MSDLYNKIISERGSLEDLVSKVPGFKGYMEKSARREADRMIRDHVAGLFSGLSARFAAAESDLVANGGLAHMEKTKSVKTKIENLGRRIGTDTPGYSGFFASNKVGNEDLAKVYAFDDAMVQYSDSLSQAVDAFVTAVNADEGVGESIAEVDRVIIEAHEAYDLRDDILNGLA